MSLQSKYVRILSAMAPVGAAGVSLLVGSTTPVTASPEPAGSQPRAAQAARISERLAAIRDAVST